VKGNSILSATIVTVIGFVSAGLITFPQALADQHRREERTSERERVLGDIALKNARQQRDTSVIPVALLQFGKWHIRYDGRARVPSRGRGPRVQIGIGVDLRTL
jgi:hypothetical protein